MLRMPFHYSFTVERWYRDYSSVLIALYSRARSLTTVFLFNIFARVRSRPYSSKVEVRDLEPRLAHGSHAPFTNAHAHTLMPGRWINTRLFFFIAGTEAKRRLCHGRWTHHLLPLRLVHETRTRQRVGNDF